MNVALGSTYRNGARYPRLEEATGQLVGFVAYDLILIGPFLRHFANLRPEHQIGLIFHTAISVYSGLLTIFYLALNSDTRLLPRWRTGLGSLVPSISIHSARRISH